jgi:hypothetical protein
MCQLNSVRVGGPGKESIRVEAKERYTNCTLQPNLAFFFFFALHAVAVLMTELLPSVAANQIGHISSHRSVSQC